MRSTVSRQVLGRLRHGFCANRHCPGEHDLCSPFCAGCVEFLDALLVRRCRPEWESVLDSSFSGSRTRWYGQFLICVQYVEVLHTRIPGGEFRDAVAGLGGKGRP